VPAGTFPAGTLPAGTLPAVRPRTGPRRRPPPAVGLTGGTNRPGGTGRAGPLGSPAGAGRPGVRAGQRGGDPGRLRLGVRVDGVVRARRLVALAGGVLLDPGGGRALPVPQQQRVPPGRIRDLPQVIYGLPTGDHVLG